MNYKVGDHMRISKVNGHFLKHYDQNWSEVFIIDGIDNKKLVNYENNKKLSGKFYESEL